MEIIQFKNIIKNYGAHQVLKDINLSVSEGAVTALMGPNGSGKSTILKCLTGLVIPTSGEVLVREVNIRNHWEYRKDLGYMPQIANFPENITVKELIGMIKDIRKRDSSESLLLDLLGITDAVNKTLKELSGGMKQKVNLILTLLFDSDILVFDEPTMGLDPVSRIKFKNIIRAERQKGKTIILSSHYMNEVEELADNIIYILDGRVHFEGSLVDLKLQYNENSLEQVAANILENNLS